MMNFSSFFRIFFVRVLCLFTVLAGLSVQAQAFIHPCIPATTQDLDAIKANLNREPWKTGYAQLLTTWDPNYVPQPYASVSRSPNVNLGAWSKDMSTVYNYARLWYFTGNNDYAKKAHDILLAWANTQTEMGGSQAGLALGDFAFVYGGGASILRGTWPGWTAADTTAVQNLFANVYWPKIAVANLPGPANKGSLNMQAGIAIALFCDDTVKFNHVLDLYRTYPGSGLANTLPNGEMGETGRDAGHGYGDLLGKAFLAECAWKQGIDLYSEGDNRLLAVGEYYCRNTFLSDNPFVDYGTVDALYVSNAYGPYGANRAALYMIQNAYKNRKGLPTPWIDRKLGEQWVDLNNFMYARTADFSTATPPAAIVRPPVSLASSGLTLTTFGNSSAGRSLSYINGVWTLTGAGADVWGEVNDACQFAYQQMTGDCAIVARVTSSQSINGATKAGVMLRDNLTANVSKRGYAAMIPNTPNQVQSRLAGDTERWAGRVAQTTDLPNNGIPYWVKIERRGNMITSYSSPDGTSWSPNVSNYFANLPSTVYVGLFIASGSATTTTTATFDNVAFTGGTGGLVTTPAAPQGLLASGSSKAITLRWLPSFGATGYDVLRSTTSGSGYTALASNLAGDKTSYVDTTAAAGTTYYYVVRAKNSAGTSGNSPQFGDALLVSPMANLAFGGTATDSAHSTGGEAINTFDGNAGSKWFNNNAAPTGWIQYDFGTGNAQGVKRYTVSSANDVPARDPKDWTFLGSQDGTTWTTLDTKTGQTFTNRYQQNVYPIGNTTAYRYYRLNITANSGEVGVQLSELGLWGDTGRTVPDGTYCFVSRKSNKLMDVSGTANGAQVVQQPFAGDDTQQWTLAWQSNGVYRATNVATSKALDNGNTSTAGTNLVIQPSGGGTNQLWKFIPDGDGFYRMESGNSGRVADTNGGSTADGANIVQAASTSNSASQQWQVAIASAPQPIPAAPTGVGATPISISGINLSWTGSSGALSYQIKRSTTSSGPYTAVSVPVTTTSYSDTALSDSTTYYYVVSAISGSGESANSEQVSATTLTAPPSAPAAPTAILRTNGVTLSWTASGGATSYNVLRATTSGGPYTTVASGLTGTSYIDTSISHATTYYYTIIATNSNGSSPASAEFTLGAGTLVTQLKFDETGGTTAADSSGRGQNATLVNGATFAAAGIVESGLNLPATAASPYASLPPGIVSGLTDFTVTTWVKVNAFSTGARIFDFGRVGDNYMYLSAQSSLGAGRPRFSIRTTSVAEQSIDSSIALTVDTWAHIAVTRSGNTVSIYINGSLAGSGNITINPADLGFTTQNNLGRSLYSDPYLNATLDDFRIYAKALSAPDITALNSLTAGPPTRVAALPGNTQATVTWLPNGTNSYTYTVKRSITSGGPYTTVATGVTGLSYTDTGLTNGATYYYVVSAASAQGSTPDSAAASTVPNTLSLHLKFDEIGGSIATDSSGRNFNATVVNSPVFSAGVINNGLDLTPTSAQYATLPSGVVSGMNDFTISTWVKVNAFATWQRIFDFGSATNSYMFLTTQYTTTAPNAAKLRFGIRTPSVGEQNVSGTLVALTTGTWTHVAVTRSGTTVSIYVNGSLAGSGTIALSPADLGVTTQNYLGKSQFNDPYLNGSIDDFRIYSQALSATEIGVYASPLAAPQNLAATPGPLSLDLSWSAVTNATGYTVKYATQSGGPYTTLTSGLATPGRSHSGLSYGTAYYYVVSATNSIYESPFSAELMVTPDSALISGAESASPGLGIIPASSENPALARVTVPNAVIGHTYQLQTSTSLTSGSWQDTGEPIVSDGSPVILETPYQASEPRRFYRVVITR